MRKTSNFSPLGDAQTGYVNGAALAASNVLRTREKRDNGYSIDMEILTDYFKSFRKIKNQKSKIVNL